MYLGCFTIETKKNQERKNEKKKSKQALGYPLNNKAQQISKIIDNILIIDNNERDEDETILCRIMHTCKN